MKRNSIHGTTDGYDGFVRTGFLTVLAVIAIAFLCLPGCSVMQAKVDNAVDDALALTLPDLEAAHARATNAAHPDPNPAHDLCWTGLAQAIKDKAAADSANAPPEFQMPNGVADAAEAALMADSPQPLKINLPQLPMDVKSACFATIGELRVKATVDALKFSVAIASTVRAVKGQAALAAVQAAKP